ncbi:MAG: hypothetical protein FWC21_04615 [Treponema sp.]|nr:hypothetical protein [Treponema sp.]
MKIKYFFIPFFAILFLSCPEKPEIENNSKSYTAFWAIDSKTEAFYLLNAELLVENSYCRVWAETGSGVSVSSAKLVADEYIKIYSKLMSVFGWTNQYGGVMENAKRFTGGDGKLCILLLDIKDDYQKGVNESYIAGYFFWVDFFNSITAASVGARTNQRTMIYLDVNPGLNFGNINELYKTLAHELQHLMNFTSTLTFRSSTMDTWIDEGLSSAAEWIYSDKHSEDRIRWYSNNGSGNNKSSINTGNNFFMWDNKIDENIYAVLDDYATVYLFFQWLRLQSNNWQNMYKSIITSVHSDFNAVTSAAAANINAKYINWDELLKDWLAANYLNLPEGPHGYKGDLKDSNGNAYSLNSHYAPENITTIGLLPGEGVYSYNVTNQDTSGQGSSIRNAYMNNCLLPAYDYGSTMLTYNSNTNKYSAQENGVVTGEIPSANANISGGRSIQPNALPITEPLRIGLWDFSNNRLNNISINDLKSNNTVLFNE